MIKKTIFFCATLILLSSCITDKCDDNKYLEADAIAVLDGMSSSIGELYACSFTLQVYSELIMDSTGVEVYKGISDVYMQDSNKLYIYTTSNKGDRGYWYDGDRLAWFNYDQNVFDTLPAPETIMQTINAAHDNYGIDFPAADFFYPTFTDDIINHFDSVFYLGAQKIDGEDISQVLAVNDNMKVNFWIANNGKQQYPVSFFILRNELGNDLQYEGDFSNWRFNPALPDNLFEFSPPEDATRMTIQPLKK